MMIPPTKRFSEWAGSLRTFFKMGGPTLTRTSRNPTFAQHEPQTFPDATSGECASEGNSVPQNTDSEAIPEETVEETELEMSLSEKMERAKKLYPGSKDWAKDEERLFEILYLRQDLPMLPSHWNVDFRGFPIPENIFETSEEHPPIIYAHSRNGSKDYSATTAITRLVDLTLSVRTLVESEAPRNSFQQRRLRRRAAELVKDTLDGFLSWAARDGGYDQLRTVPNIVSEVVDAPETQDDIVGFMMSRMRALARLQREFYGDRRDPDFWSTTEPKIMGSRNRSTLKRRIRAGMKRGLDMELGTPELCWDELASDSPDTASTPTQRFDGGAKKRRLLKTPGSDTDELAEFAEVGGTQSSEVDMGGHAVKNEDAQKPGDVQKQLHVVVKTEEAETPLTALAPPRTPSPKTRYRRKPPIVYGLYILGTSVFLLTADSSKGDSAYISFHVDINFADNHQSVWNALTVAIAVCSARDELMSRLDDFKPVTVACDSDPDA